MSDLLPCPCCGSPSLGEAGGYEICDICGWEDDPVQSADPSYSGGANHESLRSAQGRWFVELKNLDPSVLNLFIAAGCKVRLPANLLATKSSAEFAARVIADFGGLKVGATGPGREMPASDVHFYSAPRPSVDEIAGDWAGSLGARSAIATAHDDHMIIFVGADGVFYAFTDPDAKLYRIGASFAEAMNRLLLGLDYGEPIPKDA